jgi:hypothetical protein
MRRKTRGGFALGVLVCGLAAGCDDVDWPEPRYVDSLRVLGVSAEPPTLSPGASTRLSMLCVDGRGGSSEEPTCDAEVAWFAHCDNPAENDPTKCLDRYSKWGAELTKTVSETPAEARPSGFGFGPSFDFVAPRDILAGELEVGGRGVRYGTSYVFFAACAGQLVAVSDVTERLPVECRDRETGERLDQRSLVVGVTTVYSYDLVTSHNPVFSGPRFDDAAIPASCVSTADCPAEFDCSKEGQCLPVVSCCQAEDPSMCPEHCLTLELALDSFSLFSLDGARLSSPQKSLWLDYFTNAGNLPADEASLGLRPPAQASATRRTECIRWQAPKVPTEHAHLWAVVRDDRGGLATWDQRIIVQ